jgi:hypothetical protein
MDAFTGTSGNRYQHNVESNMSESFVKALREMRYGSDSGASTSAKRVVRNPGSMSNQDAV